MTDLYVVLHLGCMTCNDDVGVQHMMKMRGAPDPDVADRMAYIMTLDGQHATLALVVEESAPKKKYKR